MEALVDQTAEVRVRESTPGVGDDRPTVGQRWDVGIGRLRFPPKPLPQETIT